MTTEYKKRVLVLDSDAAFRTKTAQMISKHGCFVATADCVSSALKIIDDHSPDIVLVDPDLVGTRIEEIKRKAQVGNSSVQIFVVGSPASDTTFRMLHKPLSEAELLHTIGGCDLADTHSR